MMSIISIPRSIGVLLLLAVALIFPGCNAGDEVAGYSAKELYDANIRTVAVPIFANRTFYRETEFKLAESLIKQIESRTPYKVVNGSAADTQIAGAILHVDKQLISRTFNEGVTQEVQVKVTVSFEWKDLRSGKVLRKRSTLSGTGDYVPTKGAGEPAEIGIRTAVNELAGEIVGVMRADW